MLPEAIAAARLLHYEGVAANVLNLTSPQLLFREWQQCKKKNGSLDTMQLATLLPPEERRVPIVTVHDAASHALSWLGSVYGASVTALGVDEFGQSGLRADLYRAFGIDAESIAEAAFTALEV
jgi:pyruvate dehydrogenase E1 component